MDNIRPAISAISSTANLSSDEFQTLLRSWFDEKGIVAYLRSHLRYKMISFLKNTVIGRDIVRKSQILSLSRQALNLIVAEFLLQNKCYYSFSLFNTETCITNIFPESLKHNCVISSSENFRFNSENILNIMELIGVSKSSKICENLVNLYYGNEESSLLSCLIIVLSNSLNNIPEKAALENLLHKYVDLSKEPDLIKDIGNILAQNYVTPEDFQMCIKKIKTLREQDKSDLQNEYSKLIDQLKSQIMMQEKQITEINNSKKVVKLKLKKVSNEYKALKYDVKHMIKENLVKNEILMNAPVTKNNENNKLVLKEEISKLASCTICSENMLIIDKLKKENQSLKTQSKRQIEQIKQLSLNYNNLVEDFTECQKKIELLNSRLNSGDASFAISQSILGDLKERGSDESAENITDRIILDAHLRLKTLEEESRRIEINYKTLQQNLQQIKL